MDVICIQKLMISILFASIRYQIL